MNTANTRTTLLNLSMNFITDVFGFFTKVFYDYLLEVKKHLRATAFFLLLSVFLLSKFIPHFEAIASERIEPNTVVVVWIILIYLSIITGFCAFLPIGIRAYRKIRNAFLKIRSFAFPLGLIISSWLVFQAGFSLFSEQFLYKKIFAALLLQMLFVPLFFAPPATEDVENFRWFKRYGMSEGKKKAYKFWVILVILLIPFLLIFLIGDIYTLPVFKIIN